MTIGRTPLESALIAEFHRLYADRGFPKPDTLRVIRRTNTGAGRYVDLACDAIAAIPDGYLDLGGGFVKIPAVPNGLMAVIHVEAGKPTCLELAVHGDDPWDGSESGWSIQYL